MSLIPRPTIFGAGKYMKVLIINTCGTYTSTGNITTALYKRLISLGHEVEVCYGYKDGYDKNFHKVCSRMEYYISVLVCRLFGILGFNPLSTRRVKRIIDRMQPDVIQLYNLHGYYIDDIALLKYIKTKGIRTVYSMLDEYPYMGKCAYPGPCTKFQSGCRKCPAISLYPRSLFFDTAHRYFKKKAEAYAQFEHITFTGPQWVIERARLSPLLHGKHLFMLNEPIDTDIFHSRQTVPHSLSKEQLQGKIIILTVAVLSNPRKGGRDFIRLAERFVDKPQFLFIYVGYDLSLAHSDNLIAIPYVYSQEELAEYMSLADLFVCNSKEDTMPNVCLQAMLCGSPILCYNTSGMPYLAPSPIGKYVNDMDDMAHEIEQYQKKDNQISQNCVSFAKEQYGHNDVFDRLLSLY